MTFYADADYPVADDIAAIHAEQFADLCEPGTWWTGPERRAIAQTARNAGYTAGVLEAPGGGEEKIDLALAPHVIEIIETLAVRPADVDHAFYEKALADGLSDAEYVELVGIVARIVCFDIFARGLGVPLKPIPPASDGAPSRERPDVAVQELAWAPTVPTGAAGGALGQELFNGRPVGYIVRALSLVVAEHNAHMGLEEVQYLPISKLLVADYAHHEGLSRAQAEIVAARVSALNECFY